MRSGYRRIPTNRTGRAFRGTLWTGIRPSARSAPTPTVHPSPTPTFPEPPRFQAGQEGAVSELSFDDHIKVAWRDCAIALGRNLKQMTCGDTLAITQSTDELPGGPRGRVCFSVTRGGLIRATVDRADLATELPLVIQQERYLKYNGWRPLRNAPSSSTSDRRRRTNSRGQHAKQCATCGEFRASLTPQPHRPAIAYPTRVSRRAVVYEQAVHVGRGAQLFDLLTDFISRYQEARAPTHHALALPPVVGFSSVARVSKHGPEVQLET